MRTAFARTFVEMAEVDPHMRLVVADLSPAGPLVEFRKKYPDRFINVGVAEQTMVGLAAGLAQEGLKPWVYTIATFALFRTYEFIRNDIAYQNLPVTIVGMGAGCCYSSLGATHQAIEDVALACNLPNMTVIVPCDPAETAAATRWCATANTPVYLRLGKTGEPALAAGELCGLRCLHAGHPLAHDCILTYGPIASRALDLAAALIGAAVYVAPMLKPLDEQGVVALLHRFRRVVVLEEATPWLGPHVKALAHDTGAKCRIHAFALRNEFIHCYGDRDQLLDAHGLSVDNIMRKVINNG